MQTKITSLRELFNHQEHNLILPAWDYLARHKQLSREHLEILNKKSFIFFADEVALIRWQYDKTKYYKLSGYQAAFEKFIHTFYSSAINSLQRQCEVKDFLFLCAENIIQHAEGKGIVMFQTARDGLEFVSMDFGKGIIDENNDGIPDLLEVIKENTSLYRDKNKISKGKALSLAIDRADSFRLYSKGYVWDKQSPEIIMETSGSQQGTCIVAKILFSSLNLNLGNTRRGARIYLPNYGPGWYKNPSSFVFPREKIAFI
ncbi:MAG: hypothetical protein PHV30_11410 [Candidatus Margulisbacteria bacterium]|nr:hypothetical protein [Candidatus Margulisiibacteriota bacterium]